ncbi:hypothetical protein BDV95DRAFT_379284 [Massariosphaeria phaeospora]|uniref:DUF676 domain-containing protein n=1 Tax=Massariosphaeria phaeospora TaxID=100035 RepID=A0A7C8M6T0_9PLEO|nr:hypothetical protein BDV95DRAFT_379284 [Massariosphaeria phaeospora]
MLKICSKSFRWKPRRLAPDASQSQLHPSNALQPQSPPPRPVAHSSKSPSRKKGYGLELLYDGTDCQDGMGVDIVAIHGLNGNAYTTWKSKNGILWLRDLLPQDLPGARIYTYGYPAEVLFSKSVGDIIDFSRRFLSELKGQLMASSQNNVGWTEPSGDSSLT